MLQRCMLHVLCFIVVVIAVLGLISEVAWLIVTKLYHIWWWPRFITFGQKFGSPLPPPEIWRPKNIKILARFRTNSRLDRKYFWNATRHCQSENFIANYGHSRTGKLNLEYFDPQTDKNRTGIFTHPTGSHHGGHYDASSSPGGSTSIHANCNCKLCMSLSHFCPPDGSRLVVSRHF